jgi:hypothetical protein
MERANVRGLHLSLGGKTGRKWQTEWESAAASVIVATSRAFRTLQVIFTAVGTLMAIEFPCPHCTQLLRVADDSAGKTAKCPKCNGLAKIPGGDAPASFGPPADSLGAPLPSNFGTPSPSPFGEGPAAKNPFSDGGFSAPQKSASPFATGSDVNPYSSPAPVSSPYSYGRTGVRTGLPWDNQPQSIGVWWETFTSILSSANDAFRRMYITGGLGRPIMFAMIGLGIGQIGQLVFQLGLLSLGAAAGGRQGQDIALQMGFQVGAAVLGTVLGATLGCLIQAGILHVCLMMVGGEKNGYEATFRVCAYAAGTFGAFQIVPIVGPCVGFIWQIVATIIGLAEAHETTGGKAALAYFIPFIVVFGCMAAIFVIAFGAIASNAR